MCYNKVMDIWTRLGRYASFETERMYLRPLHIRIVRIFLRFVAILIIFVLFFQVVRRVRRVILSWFIIL